MEWINHPLDVEFFDAGDFVDKNYNQLKKIWEIITWQMTNFSPENGVDNNLSEDALGLIIASVVFLELKQEEITAPFPVIDEEMVQEETEEGNRLLELINVLIFSCALWSLEEKGIIKSYDNEQSWELTELGKKVGDAINEDETSE